MLLLACMGQETKSIYRPRRPERTGLHQAVRENLELFLETYDERFLDRHGPLTDRARRTLEEYLRCGILAAGFARVRCGDCGHEQLVAFSCQLRGVCPLSASRNGPRSSAVSSSTR